MRHPSRRRLPLILLALLAIPRLALAQADEIQVYDGGLAAPGVFNLTCHNNFTPKGVKTPAFPGAVTADKSLNGVPEWAYGVTNWFEAGLYLPLYSHDEDMGWGIDGFKLRTLFAVPNADDRTFFYGANFEFSFNAKRWDTTRFTSEIRPIIGWHLKPVDIIVNPIVDTAYDGLQEPRVRAVHARRLQRSPTGGRRGRGVRGLRTVARLPLARRIRPPAVRRRGLRGQGPGHRGRHRLRPHGRDATGSPSS